MMWHGFLEFFLCLWRPLVFPGLLRGHFLLGVAQRSVVNLHLLTFNYVLMKAVIILINCGTFSYYE